MVSCGCKRAVALGAFTLSLLAMNNNVYAGVVDADASICEPIIAEVEEAPSEEEILIEIKEMQSTIKSVDNTNAYYIENDGLHIENRDGKDILVSFSGYTHSGYGYNLNGDLYFADKQGVLWKDCIYDEMSFDENGLWVNPGMENAEQNRIWSEAFERGELLCIDGQDTLASFVNYYMAQHRLRENCITLMTTRRSAGAENFSLRLPYEMRYDRESLENSIVEHIGMPIGNTTKELTLSAVNNVCDYFDYDVAYTKRTMEDCLKDKRGVCWVYAKTVKALLDRCGVQSEIMTGFNNGENHMWLRVRDKDKWIYCDPTAVESSGDSRYFNISYNSFVTAWYPQPMAHFENWY